MVDRMVFSLHGFNEHHRVGSSKMEILRPYIESRGYHYKNLDYGYFDIVSVKCNASLARLILPQIREGDSMVAFSNGCAICARLCELGAPFESIVLIQPALLKKWAPPPQVKRMVVYWNPHDRATDVAEHWRRFANLMPWRWGKEKKHLWGEMGAHGPKSNDPRILDFNTEKTPDMPVVKGHSAWQKPVNCAWWKHIADRI